MTERRRGLGRGLGALIPTGSLERPAGERPVDVFFPEREQGFTGNTGIDRDEQPPAQGGGADPPDRDSDSRPEIQHEHVEQAGAGSDERGHQVPVPGHDAPVGPGTGHGSAVSRPETDDGFAVGRREMGDGFAVGRREMGDGSPGVAGPALSTRDLEAPPGETPSLDAVGTGQPTTGLLPVPGAQFAEIPVACIVANPRQPRQVFDEESMAELVHSIREIGVLQPVVVRQVGTDAVSDGAGVAPSYELVTGERRWRACERAGLTHVPAIVRETSDDALLRDALLENLHRSDLNPLEEAAAYQQLLDDFGCTHDELAERLGRSRPQVSNTIRLLKLPPLVQRRVAAGVLTAGHARALLGMSDAGAMERLAQRIVAEGLSVRSTEEIVALGDDVSEGPRRRSPRQGERHAALDDLATRLSDRLDTRVKIALGQRKGRLTVEFASVDDLNRILGVLVPEGERVL